jgi:hypothetical protein
MSQAAAATWYLPGLAFVPLSQIPFHWNLDGRELRE